MPTPSADKFIEKILGEVSAATADYVPCSPRADEHIEVVANLAVRLGIGFPEIVSIDISRRRPVDVNVTITVEQAIATPTTEANASATAAAFAYTNALMSTPARFTRHGTFDPIIQTVDIRESKGVGCNVAISVQAAFQTNRIALHVAPDARVVVAKIVVVKVGFLVEVVVTES